MFTAEACDAGFDDLAVEEELVDNSGAEPQFGERLRSAGKRLIRSDRDGRFFFTFGQHLAPQLSPFAVQLQKAQLIKARPIDASVAGDRLGEWSHQELASIR